MQHKNEEPVIYLKDLLFVVLYRWKTVVAAALILALTLGGAKFFSALSTLHSEEAIKDHDKKQEILLEKYEAEMHSLEQLVEALRVQVKNQNEYLAKSIYMQLDPYAFYESTIDLYFSTDYQIMPGMEYQNLDPTDSVIATYKSILNSEQTLLPLSQALGALPQYIKELIYVTENTSTDIMTITIRYLDQDGAIKLTELLLDQLEAMQPQITQTITAHEVSIVNQSVDKKVDRSIAEAQNSENARMTTLVTELTDMQAKKDALVKPASQQIDNSFVIKNSIVFAAVGFVLGTFLVTFFSWIAHFCTNKVYSARTLKNRTGIKILGCINMSRKNKIDRWICKLEGRNTNDPQMQANLLALDILNRCGNINNLLIIGSADSQARQSVVQALAQAMPGVQITEAGDLQQDISAMGNLPTCDAVLLVEQCNISKYDTVSLQIEWISDYNKELIGCVLLGG